MQTFATDRPDRFADPMRHATPSRGVARAAHALGGLGPEIGPDMGPEIGPDGAASPIVFVVEPRAFICESLDQAGRPFGWQLRGFTSTQDFLVSPAVLHPSCLVLDAALPGLDILALQERIAIDRPGMPIILIHGMPGAMTTLQARSSVGVRLLANSFDQPLLVQAIADALEKSRPAFVQWTQVRSLRMRYASLSPREREVMALVVCGRLNKQVGGELGISEITVKAHRGSTMRKMRAASLPSLVTMAAQLGLRGPEDRA